MWPAVATITGGGRRRKAARAGRRTRPRPQAAHIEHQRAVPHAPQDRDRQGAQGGDEAPERGAAAAPAGQRPQGHPLAGEGAGRRRAAADLALAIDDLDGGDAGEGGRQRPLHPLGHGGELGARARQQAQRRDALGDAVGVAVQPEHRRQRGQRQLVAAQRPLHGVAPDAGEEIAAAGDDAGLGPAEQLVAAEGDDVGARGQGLRRRRLVRQVQAGEVGEGAAAEVDDEGHAALAAQACEVGLGDRGGEAAHLEVAGMHLHHQPGGGADRRGEVLEVGAVGGADLAQAGAGAGHDLGDAEGAADLDQLAARYRHLPAQGEAVEHQQHRGGVVVDDRRRLGAGELAQRVLDVVVAIAAAHAVEVELEVGRAPRRLGDGRDGLLGQRRAAEIGVQHGAGEVEHRPQARPPARGERRPGPLDQGALAEGRRLVPGQSLARRGHRRPQRLGGRGAPVPGDERRAAPVAQQAVDRRQGAARHGSARERRARRRRRARPRHLDAVAGEQMGGRDAGRAGSDDDDTGHALSWCLARLDHTCPGRRRPGRASVQRRC